MTPPRLDDIRRDDEALDALGTRTEISGDEAITLLSHWVDAIDHRPTTTATIDQADGRYARSRRRPVRAHRVAATAGLALAALSISSVAAAVTGTNVPVFRELGHVTRGLVGEQQQIPAPARASAQATTSATSPFWPTTSADPDDDSGVSDSARWVHTSSGWVRTSPDREQVSTQPPRLHPSSSGTGRPTGGSSSTSPVTSTQAPTPTPTSPTTPSGTPTSTGSSSATGTGSGTPKGKNRSTRTRPVSPPSPTGETTRVLPTPEGGIPSNPS